MADVSFLRFSSCYGQRRSDFIFSLTWKASCNISGIQDLLMIHFVRINILSGNI